MPTPEEQFGLDYESIIEAVRGIVGTADPKAKTFNHLAFDPDEMQWANLLKSDDDLDAKGEKRVHAVCVYGEEFDYSDPGISTTLGVYNPIVPIGLLFFYQYDIGTLSDNSGIRFRKICHEVTHALNKTTDLGVRPLVKGHENLRMQKSTISTFGGASGVPVHIRAGRLPVQMQSRRI